MDTKYQQIAQGLRSAIGRGQYAAGDMLPSLPDLMVEYDAARDTVRDAVRVLSREGLVVARRGVGTVVRDRRGAALAYGPGSGGRVWSEQAGPDARDVVVAVGVVATDREVSGRLGLDRGADALHRVRHQLIGSQVVQVHEQWLPMWVVGAIGAVSDSDDIGGRGSGVDLFALLRDAGEAPARVMETVCARMPDDSESDLLEIPEGVPVLVTQRITHGVDDRPLETSVMTATGDRLSLTYTVPIA